MKKKALDKAIIETIKEERRKKREEKRTRKIMDVHVVVAIAIERWANREAMAWFIVAFSTLTMSETNEFFQHKVVASLLVNPFKSYKVVDVAQTTILYLSWQATQKSRKHVMDKNRAHNHIATRLHPSL